MNLKTFSMFQKPNPKQNFFELEQQILKFWKDQDILRKSIDQREEVRTFYDGPITANGDPHTGHALTFSMKDIIPRYWTMKGYKVDRSLGWDCQGLPVEYEVEKNLGFKEKKDIETYGVAKFNALCRELVTTKRNRIVDLEEMMGRLTNSDEEYATMDRDYIESVWWSLKELYTKGLLYEGFKVVPYSTRAGTTLSNAEVALGGYKKIKDPAITVEFELEDEPNTFILAWTTTPWTIPGNLGLAVGKEIKYVKVTGDVEGKTYILAKDLVDSVFGEGKYKIVGDVNASELVGKSYIPPFDFYIGRDNAHKIYEGEHVTTESGTGIVHLAPYGAEDNDIFQKVGIVPFDYLDDQGDFTEEIPTYAGMFYRQANPKITEDLKTKERLFNAEEYEHDMPMCWRTNTPLIYKPIKSWYIGMSTLRKNLVDNNNKINWSPDHVKNGRFGNWLSEIKDWGISRSRYWGTPLPVWKSESDKVIVIGSYEELKKYSNVEIDDPHKPFIDEVEFDFEGEHYKRIPDVIDVWYDSGAMPFARFHYPFENKEKFEAKFPAQYIAEGIDQTRGWFYSLLAISTALFDKEAYQNVVVNGTILDDNGAKLSKSKKNYVDPDILIKEFGADTIRINFFNSPIASGEDATVSQKTLKIQTQEFILPLWNIFSYLVTYANIHDWHPAMDLAYSSRKVENDTHPWDHIPFDNMTNSLDSWIVLRLQQTIDEVTKSLDNYEIQKATRKIKELFEDISKWYIRSNRDRFAEGDLSALNVLYYVYIEALKLLAPFAPFITEHIYREIVSQEHEELPESIHLTDYPVADARFLEEYSALTDEMTFVRRIAEMGHELRVQNQLKVRQPLERLEINTQNEKVAVIADWMKELIKNELNVMEVNDMMKMTESDSVKVSEDTGLKAKIGLETKISEELKAKGTLREIIRQIQSTRKTQGLVQGQKVLLKYYTEDESLKALVEKNKDEIIETTSLNGVENIEYDGQVEIKVEDKTIKIFFDNGE